MWGRKDRDEIENPAVQPEPVPGGDRPPMSPVERPGPEVTPPSSPPGTRIGKSMSVKGEIAGREDIYLDGLVEGSVKLDHGCLTIGVNGNVQADIDVHSLVLSGRLKGKVHVVERIEIKKTGSFEGDIVAGNIVMEDGAIFRGSIDIAKPKRKQATVSSAKPAQPPITPKTRVR